jgi:beta-N-acetylhexosaminidase
MPLTETLVAPAETFPPSPTGVDPSTTALPASETSTLTPTQAATATPELTLTANPNPWVMQTLAGMSLEQKVGQMLMIGVDGQQVSAFTCGLIQRLRPGAIVYRSGNARSPEQLRAFSADLQECAQRAGMPPLWIAIDHEGQYVNRFETGATVFPSAMAVGATGSPANAYKAALKSGQELAYSGVNLVLGPTADVLLNFDNSVISIRSYGGDAGQVSDFVDQAVKGYLHAGVMPVLKHYPGHGGTAGDTHEVLAVDDADLPRLEEKYFPPFQSGVNAGAQAVMFSHVAFPAIDGTQQPATVSLALVESLRQGMEFPGFILTDSMGMGAIKNAFGDVGNASVRAVEAGIDMLLTTSTETAQSIYQALLVAGQSGEIPVGRIESAAEHILAAKVAWGLQAFPLTQAPTPDWDANRNDAFEIGYHAVVLLRNRDNFVPLSQTKRRILVVGPEDGWGLYPPLQTALNQAGFSSQLVTYSGPWNGPVPDTGYLSSLPAQAAKFDLVLVFTWEAHLNHVRYGDAFQGRLVNNLLDAHRPTMVVALKSPTDLLEFSRVSTYLETFGTTSGQIQGLVDALVGKFQPDGKNPLPELQ